MRLILATLLLFAIVQPANAFEIVNEQKSFENDRLFSLNLGLGINHIAYGKGMESSNPGMVIQTAIGHRINQWLEAQLVYQISTFRFNSPDPIAPTSVINTRTGLHQEYVLLKAYYPYVVAQPYLSVGFGSYQFFGLNSETALSFPAAFEIPFGAGFQTFIYKNTISLDFDFTYHMILGENQDATTLNFIRRSSVSFDIYSIIGGFSFHFL
jgi:hypothetical protein